MRLSIRSAEPTASTGPKTMPSIRSRKKSRRFFWCMGLIVAALIVGYLAKPYMAAAYHQWSARRCVQRASEFLGSGDHRHALIEASNALRHSGLDAEAIRIMAKSLEAIGATEAEEWRARLASLQPNDTENVLAQARAALKTSGPAAAEQFLNSLDGAARDSAAFHAMAGTIATEKNDAAAAETHWAEAARLEPEEKRHRLNLAGIRLASKTPGVREAAIKALDEMQGNPATSLEAMRLLLGDAIRKREATWARTVADALVQDPRCTFADRLTRLSTLRMIQDARSATCLLELRDAAVSEPVDLCTLLLWMNANDLSLMVTEWVRWMPPEMIARPPVCLGVSEAYVRTTDWQKLNDLTSAAKWGELDFMRKAYLACALEHLDEAEEAAKEWSNAVAAARGRTNALERLAKFALQVKWTKRADELKWALAALPQSPRWALDALWQDAFQRGDTAQLHKLSGAFAKADPRGIASRNNYAFLSLLTRSTEGDPHGIAGALHREQPGNALVTSTYALSLYLQGKTAESTAVMSALNAEDLRQPQVALYHAIFLFANRQPEKAEEYLRLSAPSQMLPEEKTLLDRVKAASLKPAESEEGAPSPKDSGAAR